MPSRSPTSANPVILRAYRLRLMPLTDLHVGSGEVVNPGEYFVFDDDLQAYFIDLGQATTRNAKLREFVNEQLEKSDWLTSIRTPRFQQYVTRYARFSASLGDDATGIHENWGKRTTSLGVNLLPRAVTGPYIPGSSLKGAIRTALVAQGWQARDRRPSPPPRDRPREVAGWEREVMGARPDERTNRFDISTDPLRNLRVSDANLVEARINTVLHRVSRFNMAPDKDAAELQDYRECLPGVMVTDGRAYYLEGHLTVSAHPREGQLPLLQATAIIRACAAYYATVVQAEQAYWRGFNHDFAELYATITDEAADRPGGALIRLGWGSGQTAMQVTGEAHPTTRALIGGYPAGWALFTLDSESWESQGERA